MADIIIPKRTQLPPGQTGAVKPPLSLADDSAVQNFGAQLQQFGAEKAVELTAARAANEYAAFQGGRNAKLAEFETYVAAHPGDSIQQIEKQRDKMLLEINSLSQQATTLPGKEKIKNDLLRNKQFTFEKTQASIQAVRSQQEFATYKVQQENNINTFDKAGYIQLQDDQVEAGLLFPELAEAQREHDFAIMDSAQKKLNDQQLFVGIRETAMSMATEQQAEAFIDASPLDRTDRNDLIAQVGRKFDNQSAIAAQEIEANQVKDRASTVDGISSNAPDMEAQIKLSSLEPDEQDVWVKKWDDRNKAIADGEVDPWTVDDSAVVNDLRAGISKGEVDETELASRLGIGLSKPTYDELFSELTEPEAKDVLSRPSVKDGDALVSRMRGVSVAQIKADVGLSDSEKSQQIAQEELIALSNQDSLRKWAKANASDPNFDAKYRQQVENIYKPIIEKVTLGFFEKILSPKKEGGIPLASPLADIFLRSESQELAQERMQVLKKDPVFDTLNKEEKKTALKFFEQGGTVQQIKDKLSGE